MIVLNKTNLEKLDLLIGFVNAIVYKVSSTEEHLSPNCNGSSVLEIGYYRDDNDSLHLSTSEFGEKKTDFKGTLEEIENLLDNRLTVNSTNDWLTLKGKPVKEEEKDMVKVICYGTAKMYERQQAIEEFTSAICCSEGSEQGRYCRILSGLRCGKKEVSDGDPELNLNKEA